MKNLIVLMSHEMTQNQKNNAYETLHIRSIIECSKEIKQIWGNIEPKSSLDISKLDLIIKWIEESSKLGDYVLVQGEFGATFYIVDYCLQKGRVPIYATTKRQVVEEIKGEKILTNRIFKHEGFRKYIGYSK